MINDAIAAYIRNNMSLDVYFNQAPLDSVPCIVITDNGDFRERHWGSNSITSGLVQQEYQITVYYDLDNGGGKTAAQKADSLLTLLDNYTGPLVDTAASPNVSHRVAHIGIEKGGGSFDAAPEIYGHTVFATVTYA